MSFKSILEYSVQCSSIYVLESSRRFSGRSKDFRVVPWVFKRFLGASWALETFQEGSGAFQEHFRVFQEVQGVQGDLRGVQEFQGCFSTF